VHVPTNELHSIIKPWPFRGWALDVIVEIRPNSSKGHRFILVGIDYFTKWIEVVPLPKVDQKAIISFIQNYILYRFGVPETITTDQGSAFVGRKMVEFAEQVKSTSDRLIIKKVKPKSFSIGDLVWKVLLPMDKKDRFLGKQSPRWEGLF